MRDCYHKPSKTIAKKCSVKWCNRKVMEGNHFLCKEHFYGSSPHTPLDEHKVFLRRPFTGGRVDE